MGYLLKFYCSSRINIIFVVQAVRRIIWRKPRVVGRLSRALWVDLWFNPMHALKLINFDGILEIQYFLGICEFPPLFGELPCSFHLTCGTCQLVFLFGILLHPKRVDWYYLLLAWRGTPLYLFSGPHHMWVERLEWEVIIIPPAILIIWELSA